MMRKAQRGVVLIIALIVLAAMSLAAISLIRAVDTGLLVSANLAFRQSATMAGDAGIEAARSWLMTNSSGTTLHTDTFTSTSAYSASAQDAGSSAFNPATYAWETGTNSVCINSCNTDVAGNQIRYVIHRLCDTSGSPLSVSCMHPAATSGSSNNSSKGAASYGSQALTATAAAYYRITVRVLGPKRTISYIQAVVY